MINKKKKFLLFKFYHVYDEKKKINFFSEDTKVPVNVSFDVPHPDLLKIEPKYLIYQKKSQKVIKVFGNNPGSLIVSANVTPANQTVYVFK